MTEVHLCRNCGKRLPVVELRGTVAVDCRKCKSRNILFSKLAGVPVFDNSPTQVNNPAKQ